VRYIAGLFLLCGLSSLMAGEGVEHMYRSIREWGVLPQNTPATNRDNLQKAIDWAAPRGAALFVEPSEEPYPIAGGVILKMNASLIGVHGPVGRGTKHSTKPQPVGSVFAIEDEKNPFLTVESGTQIRGIQFWYPKQTHQDADKIIAYPPTIQVSKQSPAQGVTLSCLTFYGEYTAMDFAATPQVICEQILIEHCYGYPLSGQFIRIDYCYDIPRILHCHVNPANTRQFNGGFKKAVIDAVVAKKSFAYWIDHTDNAQVLDAFMFGTGGGIYLGQATYGQMTNFNFDCVTIGIQKLGDNAFNRTWQISQGSIIANAGARVEDIHPIIVEGQGHMGLTNVECFSGLNEALTCVGQSQDFLQVRGDQKVTVTLSGCRMRNYAAASPIAVVNPKAVILVNNCIDKDENPFQWP
jgi:hypothetical protein